MPIPNSPKSMDEFNQKAKDFVSKAKEAGKSNTAISNTLKLMYKMTVQNMQTETDRGSEWDVARDADGNLVWINKSTQESKPFEGDGGFDFGALEAGDTGPTGATGATGSDLPAFSSDGDLEDLFATGPQQTVDPIVAATEEIDKGKEEKPGVSTDLDISQYEGIELNPFQQDTASGLTQPGGSSFNKRLQGLFGGF